ncbi:heterokaryon incompatibility protein-domain-containing protein, partial [Bisporella sp. PMI_857]
MSECAPLYQPLHPDRDEIRLLTVKLSENSKIECSLEIVSFTDNPKYAGLSYVWGDPNATEEITIDKLSVKVGTNLAAALRRTPRAWAESFPGEGVETFRLWADALCINQQDLAEKSEQIQKMAKIYTQASVV